MTIPTEEIICQCCFGTKELTPDCDKRIPCSVCLEGTITGLELIKANHEFLENLQVTNINEDLDFEEE